MGGERVLCVGDKRVKELWNLRLNYTINVGERFGEKFRRVVGFKKKW